MKGEISVDVPCNLPRDTNGNDLTFRDLSQLGQKTVDSSTDVAVQEDLEFGADSLIRLRDHNDDDWRRHLKESVRYPQESLHSFRFSRSTSSTTRTDIAELRKSLLNRSKGFMGPSKSSPWKKKNNDSLPAHYHASSLLNGIDESLSLGGRLKTKSVGCSPVAFFNIDQYRANRRRQQTNPMNDIQERKRPDSPVTPEDGNPGVEKLKTTPSSGSNDMTSTKQTHFSRTSTASCSSCTSLSDGATTSSGEERPDTENVYSSAPLIQQPALHNSSRFLPQNQAILTTYDDWRVILSNDIAASVLVGAGGSCRSLVGKSVVEFVDPLYRTRLLEMISKRRKELSHLEYSAGGIVLVCGNVLPIVKQDNSRSAASLWLKEKRNDAGSPVYIWIFEEVFETVTNLSIDVEGTIHYADENVEELYGYNPSELLGKTIDTVIPSLASVVKTKIEDINRLKYFGSKTKFGAYFPIVVKVHTISRRQDTSCYTLRITSIPMIAGLVTIRRDGTIEGCNAEFVKYMFGISEQEFVSRKQEIGNLLPQVPYLLQCLQRDDLLQHGIIINNLICRKLVADCDETSRYLHPTLDSHPQARKLSSTPNGQPLPILIAIHRDKTPFEVQLQLKLMDGTDDICALWVTFDREATFARYGHATNLVTSGQEVKHQDGLGWAAAKREIPNGAEPVPFSLSLDNQTTPADDTSNTKTVESALDQTPSQVADRPTRIITSFSRPTFTTVQDATVPSSPLSPCPVGTTPRSCSSNFERRRPSLMSPHQVVPEPEYSAQNATCSIDDYLIVDNLGQGAYGTVKLAIRKDDPEKKKVVIKYVIKSRILVDCWTKDRRLGVIPVEIHILHTLRKIPHPNCSDMLDYFEDDDHYYIAMGLHGIGMDLFDYIELKNGMDDDEIRGIFKQIALGVQHLHNHKIVHRDIKDENVVLDQNGGVRLIDFGSAAYLKGRRFDTFVGTLDYAAPEILAGQTYEGPPQDIWALGILLYTLVYRENPFYDIDEILSHELRIPFVLSEGKAKQVTV
ncbi:hypothetical protein BX666DRAFT_1914391 [Dichotomocladium elegans]|nr:hypothetical protein BX666DRAFT_1914391 [Dichotomocladium elegans]